MLLFAGICYSVRLPNHSRRALWPTSKNPPAIRVMLRMGKNTHQGIPSTALSRLTDAKDWAKITEGAIKDRRYFKNTESKKRTLRELIDRYM